MDFTFSDEQDSIRKLAAKIFGDLVTPKSLLEAERSDGFDRRLWHALGQAGMLGVAVPAEYGGGGLGFAELCLVCEQVGRAVAPVPLVPSLVMGALAIAEFGGEAHKRALLPGAASGEIVLGAALDEEGAGDPARPRTAARKDAAGYLLDGVKTCVQAAGHAHRLLVPATLQGREGDANVGVFLVDPRAAGVTLEAQTATTGEPLWRMTLRGVRVGEGDLVGDGASGARMVAWIVERATVALCAMEIGVAARQLEMTSEFVLKRQQFGKPIGLFQAVAQRAADAYIDAEAIKLSTWEAMWRLVEGLPATKEVAIAKFWASEGGARVAAAAQHLHGGMGFDKGYPLYRYYLRAKQIELTLGAANQQLAKLGALLAE